jgi:uncharacterized membrane protein (UPF0127 family)
MLRTLVLVIANLLLASAALAQQAMPQTELTVGMYRIEAEVAATGPNREVGLMNRKSMPQQHGMVFVFSQPWKHCMWMRNTLLPLSVAFLDEKGVIINIEDMQPHTENNHCAERNARYALEMNLGWFKSRGFGPGTPIAGVERLRPFD